MPELPPFNPSVSVFHFTSKVSSAKIRKYKLATERGMTVGNGHANTVPPGTNHGNQAGSTTAGEPAAKRQRLKLNVRERKSTDGDTIAVSRPRRSVASKNPTWLEASGDEDEIRVKRPRSPATTSELSSVSSVPASFKGITSANGATPSSARDNYGDLMSYYILDGDDDDSKTQSAQPKKQTKPPAKSTAPRQSIEKPPLAHQSKQATSNHPAYHYPPGRPALPPTRPPQASTHQSHAGPNPPPSQMVQVPIYEQIRVDNPDPVPIMIKKLEALSSALTDFGGVPAVPTSPGAPTKESAVENFLAMFNDDSDSKAGSEDDDQECFKERGIQDGPLTYGIQFIMNALKSWAQQRLAQQHLQMSMQPPPSTAEQLQQRGPGRPRKPSSEPDVVQPTMPAKQPMQPNQVNLYDTPEGRAIAAFRAVVESGCLRINAIVPADLARALRHLYMQIDHLINQTSKNEPSWRCMSYTAQIYANRTRVEDWKKQQVQAQEEMIRQHQLSHQQMMRQMGLPASSTATMFFQQPQDPNATEAERRTSLHNLVRLPVNPKPNSASMMAKRLNGSPNVFDTSQSPLVGLPAGSPPMSAGINGTGPTTLPHGVPGPTGSHYLPQALHGANGMPVDRLKLFLPGYLPRSGQSMKFSFAPTNDAAIQAFGAQAFPSTSQNPSGLPNRGPMTSSPGSVAREAAPGDQSSRIATPTDKSQPIRASDNVAQVHAHPQAVSTATNKPTTDQSDSIMVASSGFTPVNAVHRNPTAAHESVNNSGHDDY